MPQILASTTDIPVRRRGGGRVFDPRSHSGPTSGYESGAVNKYLREVAGVTISAGEARSRLFPLMQQVNGGHTPVRIASKAGDVVLMSAEDFDSWQETICLARSPASSRRLMEAVARDRVGEAVVARTMAGSEAMAGDV